MGVQYSSEGNGNPKMPEKDPKNDPKKVVAGTAR